MQGSAPNGQSGKNKSILEQLFEIMILARLQTEQALIEFIYENKSETVVIASLIFVCLFNIKEVVF